jgi:hypothetical protein
VGIAIDDVSDGTGVLTGVALALGVRVGTVVSDGCRVGVREGVRDGVGVRLPGPVGVTGAVLLGIGVREGVRDGVGVRPPGPVGVTGAVLGGVAVRLSVGVGLGVGLWPPAPVRVGWDVPVGERRVPVAAGDPGGVGVAAAVPAGVSDVAAIPVWEETRTAIVWATAVWTSPGPSESERAATISVANAWRVRAIAVSCGPDSMTIVELLPSARPEAPVRRSTTAVGNARTTRARRATIPPTSSRRLEAGGADLEAGTGWTSVLDGPRRICGAAPFSGWRACSSAARKASFISATEVKRSLGSLAVAFKMTCSTDSGMLGATDRGLGRGSLTCLSRIAMGESDSNGSLPVVSW